MNFTDEWAAIVWICRYQTGRRNMTNLQRTVLIAQQVEAERNTRGGDSKSAHAKNQKPENAVFDKPKDTAHKVAEDWGIINHPTVEEAIKFKNGLDAAESIDPGIESEILTGKVKAPKSYIAEIAKLPEPERKEAVRKIMWWRISPLPESPK